LAPDSATDGRLDAQDGAPLDSAVRRIHARKNEGEIGTLIGTDAKLYVDSPTVGSTSRRAASPPVNVIVGGYGTAPAVLMARRVGRHQHGLRTQLRLMVLRQLG
jgi:hypothetical protein